MKANSRRGENTMNILEVIKERRSAKAFKPDSISRKIITESLN